MKPVVYAPAALDSFDDILEYTADTFGEAQALTYTEQLVARIEALAAGAGPRARPCALPGTSPRRWIESMTASCERSSRPNEPKCSENRRSFCGDFCGDPLRERTTL